MKTYAIRLRPNFKIRKSLEEFATKNNMRSGCVLTCVGSLSSATLRMAGADKINEFVGEFEIVSLVGTLETDDCHLHISISDKEGNVIGGHLKEGVVGTTAEIVICELEGLSFSREMDEETGFPELVISDLGG